MATTHRRNAFTLIELLTTIAIVGVLIATLLPAVQYCRESARRVQCENNLRQIGLGLHSFHSVHQSFPAGHDRIDGRHHSWCTFLLPYLEQLPIYERMDMALPWNDPVNFPLSKSKLPLFVCPNSMVTFDGETDYGGVKGSILSGMPGGTARNQAFGCGVLVDVTPTQPEPNRIGGITDGTSNTIAVCEDVDKFAEDGGMWAWGFNILSHDNGPINQERGEIFGWHPGGAYVLMADGSVVFLTNETDKWVIGALCTGNGGETASVP